MTRTRFFDALKSYHWVRGLLALLCCLLILFASFAPPVRAAVLVDDVLMYMIGGAMSAMGISFGSAAAYESGVSSFWSKLDEANQMRLQQKRAEVVFLQGLGNQIVEWAADEWEKLCDSVVSFFGTDTTITSIPSSINCIPLDNCVNNPDNARSRPIISLVDSTDIYYDDCALHFTVCEDPLCPFHSAENQDFFLHLTVNFSDGSSFVGYCSCYTSDLYPTREYDDSVGPFLSTFDGGDRKDNIIRIGIGYLFHFTDAFGGFWNNPLGAYFEAGNYFTPCEFYFPDGSGGALSSYRIPGLSLYGVRAGDVDLSFSYNDNVNIFRKFFSDALRASSSSFAIPISIDDVYYPVPAAAIPTAIPKTTVVPATMEQALALTAEEAAPAVLQPPAPVPPPPPELPDISLPTLIFTQKFPFCLPYDLAKAFSGLFDTPEAPKFVLPFKIGNVINEEVTIDLEKYTPLAMIVRWGLSVLMVIGLILVSRKLIGAE